MADGKHQKISVVQKTIIIKPGMSSKTRLTFKGEGNLIPDSKRSDLVIIFE
jgi:DnaJ-class molecular chaperone